MREVRTCDFCEDDATGAFEPYPSALPDGPRLLLCDDCRNRLASIVDPLVARIDGGSSDAVGESATHETAGSDEDEEAPDRSRPEPGVEESPTDDEDGSGVGDSTDAGGRSAAERAGTPPNYRKVMRFLENRQLPVERDEAERLAAEAYEIEPATVADVIDHAVAYGRLREVRGQLKR